MNRIRSRTKSVACGSEFSLFVSEEGETYSTGRNSRGQCGLSHQNDVDRPTLVSSLKKKIMGVACGFEFSYFITIKLEVFSCGRNEYGQLAHGHTSDLSTPMKVAGIDKVLSVSCGDSHVCLLLKDGRALSSGYNGQGELGIGNTENKMIPTHVIFPKSVRSIQIGCGEFHSVFLGDSGELYGCGSNKYGRLGLNNGTDVATSPQVIRIPNDERVVQFSLGSANTYVLTENHVVFACGYNSRHQLGTSDTADRDEFIKVNFPGCGPGIRIEQISAGLFSYNCFFLTNCGRVYGCGFNRYGQLGDGKKAEKQVLKEIHVPNRQPGGIVHVISSGHHSIFLTKSGSVLATGRNQHGQLGVGRGNDRLFASKVIFPHGVKVPVEEGRFTALAVVGQSRTKRETMVMLKKRYEGEISKFLAGDTSLSPEVFVIKFKDEDVSFETTKQVNLPTSYAVQVPAFQQLISKRHYYVNIHPVYQKAVSKVCLWINGETPMFEDIDAVRLSYDLAGQWKMPNFAMHIVTRLDVKFGRRVKDVLDLIFSLEENSLRGSALFLQCQHLLKRHYRQFVEKFAPYALLKKNEVTQDLYFELLGIFFKDLPPLATHRDFAGCDKEFDLQDAFRKHLSNLLTDDKTKNLALRTTDGKIVKVHKEILCSNSYFNSLLTGGFSESLQTRMFRTVDIALDSQTLVPLIVWIYRKKLDFKLFDYNRLSVVHCCAKRFCMSELKKVCKEEFTRRFVYNTFSEKDIRKILINSAEMKLENMLLKYDLNDALKKIKNLEDKIKK